MSFSAQQEEWLLPAELTVYCVPLAKYSQCYQPFAFRLAGSASFAQLQKQVFTALQQQTSQSNESHQTHQQHTSNTADFRYTRRVATRPSDVRLFRFAVKQEEEEEECEWMSDLRCLAQESKWVRDRVILDEVTRKVGDGSEFDELCGNEVTAAECEWIETAFPNKPRFLETGNDEVFMYFEVVPRYSDDCVVYYVNLVSEADYEECVLLMESECTCGVLLDEIRRRKGWKQQPLLCYTIDEGTFFDIQSDSAIPSFARKYQRNAQLCVSPMNEAGDQCTLCCCVVINEWRGKEGAVFSPYHIPRLLYISVEETYAALFNRLQRMFGLEDEECKLAYLDGNTELSAERNEWTFVAAREQTIGDDPVDEAFVAEDGFSIPMHPPFFALYRKQYIHSQLPVYSSLHVLTVCFRMCPNHS